MNERIDELMIQAGARFEFLHGVHYDNFQYKTFARLIVKECADIAREVGTNTVPEDFALDKCYEIEAKIKEYFGVENE